MQQPNHLPIVSGAPDKAPDDLNDSLEDLFGPNLTPRVLPSDPAAVRMRAVVEEQEKHIEKCQKCNGSGRFIGYTGRMLGPCFKCKGSGKQEFSQPANVRAMQRAKAAERKGRKLAENLDAFKSAYPGLMEYMAEKAPKWPFAADLVVKLAKYGSLTDGQVNVMLNARARDEERAFQRNIEAAERQANAPVVDSAGVDRLKAAFDKAVAFSAEKGLKLSPKITIDGMVIKPAKATGKNPGALYVTQGGEYLGKIADGRFFAVQACTPEQAAKIQQFMANPAEAAQVYGQTTGTCCICSAKLISAWKHKGIGPICAEKFGF